MGLPLFGTPEYETHEEAVQHAAEKKKVLAKAKNDLAELKAYFSEVTEELFDSSAWVDEVSVNFIMQARGGGEGLVLGPRQSLAQIMESISIDDVLNIGSMTGTDCMPVSTFFLKYSVSTQDREVRGRTSEDAIVPRTCFATTPFRSLSTRESRKYHADT
jgi:hypothetical protein